MGNSNNKDTYRWDPKSMLKKATSNLTITVNLCSTISLSKTTAPNNDDMDCFRGCINCGKHVNLHSGYKCVK